MEENKEIIHNQNESINEEIEALEQFNETTVEPINFTRKSLYEEDSLSYL